MSLYPKCRTSRVDDSVRQQAAQAAAGDSGGALPILTVIIPVYNEAGTIDELLRRVVAAPYTKQVIIVDDGSTDTTAEVIEACEQRPRVGLLQHAQNLGKGAAIRTALEQATGRFTIIQDGDLEDYPRLIEPLLNGQAEVVFGSRFLLCEGGPLPPRTLFRCGVVVLNLCVRLLYGARLTDEATCYKAIPTSLLREMDLQCERFEFCPEVTAKVCRLGLTIHEVPVHYYPRNIQDGKKLRWHDGLKALLTLWKWRKWQGRESMNRMRRTVADADADHQHCERTE